jgi:ribose transport system ATP-binding protein
VEEVLRLRGLSKAFGGVRALVNVDLDVRAGEVHGLLGENGSGKSTLIKVLAGYHTPDEGELQIHGRPVKLPLRPGQFREFRMAFVHQDLGLVPSLTALDNLRIGHFASTRQRWYISWRQERARAAETFSRYRVELDPLARVRDLVPAERALLAIIRAVEEMWGEQQALGGRHGILFLDEPTAFLPRDRVDELFAPVRRIADSNASVVFVSHDLEEARRITDRITVLRDGRNVGTVVTAETRLDELVRLIVGHQLQPMSAQGPAGSARQDAVSVDGLTGAVVKDLSFGARPGEVLGLTGLMGSGFAEVPYLMFGARQASRGHLRLFGDGHDLQAINPPEAIRSGIALIPADRQREGSVGSLPLSDNVMVAVIARYFQRFLLHHGKLVRDARGLMDQFDIRPRKPDQRYAAFSGGNQQKALLAKWLQTAPRLLLLHEPTQGVDVGARLTIIAIIRETADRGAVVICASSDYEQLALMCDRVLVFGRGRVVQELTGAEVTKERITEQCLRSVDVVEALESQDAGRPT